MTKPPTEAKKTKAAPPKRPSDLHRALSLLHGERPLHVPETALLLVAWVDLPGDNTQRTQHWAVKRRWQEAVKDHFAQCLALQPHPGVLESPMVHVQMRVAAPGDERNRTGRAKYLLDKLQLRREVGYVGMMEKREPPPFPTLVPHLLARTSGHQKIRRAVPPGIPLFCSGIPVWPSSEFGEIHHRTQRWPLDPA